MTTIAPIPQTLLGKIMNDGEKQMDTGLVKKVPAVDKEFRELDSALERKGQAILYGPPGTGKTYIARRFAVWWSLKQSGYPTPDAVISDRKSFEEAEDRLSTSKVSRNVWWVVANPKNWSWDRLPREKFVDFQFGRIQKNYPMVRKGDLVVGYQSTPDSRIVALATVTKELHTNDDDEQVIQLGPLARIENGPTWDQLKEDKVLKESEPIRHLCRGTLFALSAEEFDQLSDMLTEVQPDLKRHLYSTDEVGPLTRMTFHPSYSYEDFIEGFRPMDSKGGNLTLRLEDGIFKRVCRAAQSNPQKPYLVMIDEINRANVAKVFGEIITLLEKDKRGMRISLPQSKEPFSIPKNVFVLGTMNTSDRSIKLLDSAMRRRFAFIELMPDSSLLQGGRIGNLAVDEFLDALNRRIAAKEGREKQIGHSFFMEDDVVISDVEEFARRFRQEVLPLLQEYCYEDYGLLAGYIGEKLVNKAGQMLNGEVLNDTASLMSALEKEFEKDSSNQ